MRGSRMQLYIFAGKPGALVCAGGRPDRLSSLAKKVLLDIAVDDGEDDVWRVQHQVLIPDLDDERRRAVRQLLVRQMGLELTTRTDSPDTDRWSIPDEDD